MMILLYCCLFYIFIMILSTFDIPPSCSPSITTYENKKYVATHDHQFHGSPPSLFVGVARFYGEGDRMRGQ
jgi:hypothetical protein